MTLMAALMVMGKTLMAIEKIESFVAS